MSLANESAARTSNALGVFLACGFTPQHAKTFLTAYLADRVSDRKVIIEPGLYGDLIGSLERLDPQQADAVAIILEWPDLDPRFGYRSSEAWRLATIEDMLATASTQLDRLRATIDRLATAVSVALALPSLPLPPAFKAPLASADPVALTLHELVYRFAAHCAAKAGVRVVNPQRLDQLSPPGQRSDVKSDLRWGLPYTIEHTSIVCQLLAQLIAPPSPKKAIITDLDDTLWRGILGEDGVEGISWDLDHSSHVHAMYQRMLASLADAGVLIGVATKNDPKLVDEALARKDLIVPADLLFPVDAHWGPKSESVGRILEAWNIGPESVVFIDDSALEIAEITTAYSEIRGFLFPTLNEAATVELLETLRDLFGKVSVSEEDRLRLLSLRNDDRRATHTSQATIDQVLAHAEAKITLSYDKPDQRAFDLINKTNQFNLNGRRIDESGWRARLADPGYFLLTVSYSDKFGPLGKIAVVSGTREPREPLVDIWVMSCRAFSRRIEHQVLKSLFERLDASALRLDLTPTPRNAPLREFVAAIAEHEAQGAQGPVRIERRDFLSRCPQLFAKVNLE